MLILLYGQVNTMITENNSITFCNTITVCIMCYYCVYSENNPLPIEDYWKF